MKRQFRTYLIVCTVFLMMLSLVSPTLSAVFAEETDSSSSSATGSSVTGDTYSSSDTTSTTTTQATSPATETATPLFTVQSHDPSVTSATYDTYADGEYNIAYQVMRTNASGKVVASNVFKSSDNATNPGQLTIDNGHYHFSFKSNNAYLFTQFKATQNEQTNDAEITLASGSTTKGTVTFDVYDLTKEINIAYTFNGSSNNERLTLDPSTLKVIDKTPPVIPVEPATGTETSIAYTVLKDGTSETSMMDSYLQKPAKLITNGNQKYVQLTLNNSNWIQALQTDVDKDNNYTDVDLISSNETTNTRIIQFAAHSLSKTNPVINAKVHVVIPAGTIPNMGAYDEWYTVQFSFDSAAIPLSLADGQYSLTFATLKEKTDDASSMANYFGSPATVVAKNGKYEVILNIIKDSSVITSLQTEQNGAFTETSIVSTDTTANTRVVKFSIANLESIVNAKVHIKTSYAGSVYESDYPIRFKWDTTNIAPVVTPIPDSSTTLNYQVFKDNSSEISVMDAYVVKPATLITKGEKKYIQLTLKNSAWIKSLQVDGNGGKNYTDVTVISTDVVANTRLIQFEASHLSKTNPVLNAYTHVVIPPEVTPKYDHYYTIQFKFDSTQLPEPTTPTVPTPVVIDNGTYTIPMSTLKSTSDAVSTMGSYFDSKVTLTAVDGKYQVSLNVIKDSSVITAFKTEQNGTLTDTQIVSEDKTNNTRIVTFPVTDPSRPLNAQVHIKTSYAGSVYESDYPIHLKFDLANMTLVPVTPEEPTTPTVPTNPGEVADGKYSASFVAYKFKEKTLSVMDEYTLKPATVIKRSGKLYVQITLKESDWIKTFKVGGSDAQVISTSGNQRVVQFAVKDLSETIVVNTHIFIPEGAVAGLGVYDHTYNVDFKFGSLGPYEEPKASTTSTPVIPLDYDKLSNGKYNMPFQVLVPNSSSNAVSPVQRFISKDQPAQLVVEGDQRYAIVTLQDAKAVKALRVSNNGVYTDAEVTATDEQANTKTVRFSVSDFKKNIAAQLVTSSGVSIASTPTDNTNETVYDFEFKFDTAKVTKDTTETTTTVEKGTNTIEDGEYTAQYRILKNGSEQDSILADYVDQTAHLTAKNGKVYATITIKNSQAVPKFQTDFEGKYTDPTIVANTTISNARTVTFEVPNLDQKLSIFSQVSMPDRYLNNEKMGGQILFDRNTLQANGIEPTVTAPVQETQPPASTPTSTPITESTEVQATPEQKYTIAYKVYKDQSSELSVMNDYVDKKATLIEKDGKTFAQITLDKSSWMPVLQVKQNGTLQDVEVISTSGDQRVVQFEVNDLSKKISAYTHVIVPGLVIGGVAYDHWYSVQFQFDLSSKKEQ